MRVLQLIDSLEAGGAERMAVNIANALSGSVERSYLCATRQEGLLKGAIHPDVGYLFLAKKRTLDIKALFKLVRFIRSERIAIVHAHSTSFFLATLIKLLHSKIKIVWHDHYGNSDFLEQRPSFILKFASLFFSHIYSVNTDLEQWSRLHLKSASVSYLPNFVVDNSNESPVTVLQGVAGKRILCLANLRPQKDHFTLLEAFKIVYQQHPDWSLHCVGRDFKDAYSQSVYALATDLELEASVFFYGSCPDTGSIIQQCALGVLASQSEGLPLALLEYGLGPLPVVCTDVGDCHRVINTGASGLLVASQDAQALAEGLLYYLNHPSERIQQADRLHETICTQFSKAAIVQQILQQYTTIIS